MSIAVMTMVWRRLDIGGSHLLLALALADRCDDQGGSLWPSNAHLAAKTRQTQRNVRRQLMELRAMGWLQVVKRGGMVAGHRMTNRYQINPLWLQGHVLPGIPEVTGDNLSPQLSTDDAQLSLKLSTTGDMAGTFGGTNSTGREGLGVPRSVLIHQDPKSGRRSRSSSAAPARPSEERVRAARAMLTAMPDYPAERLQEVYGLSPEELAQVQAPSAEYSK